MSFYESVILAVFGLGVVFVVLISLSAIIGIQSRILNAFTRKKKLTMRIQHLSKALMKIMHLIFQQVN